MKPTFQQILNLRARNSEPNCSQARKDCTCNCQIKSSFQPEISCTALLTGTPRLHKLSLVQAASKFTSGVSHCPDSYREDLHLYFL